jgi:nicotinate-nucleotide adenylyltransferase
MIGIFGGTFDPVHYGHIKPALSVQQALSLTQLRFIPNKIPPHREAPWLNVEQRLSLLQTALADIPSVIIDERELSREGPSYMLDTLKSLHHDFPDEKLCLIIGLDAFIGINTWFEWRALFDLCHLVVTTRPGFAREDIRQAMNAEDYQFLCDKMVDHAAALTSAAPISVAGGKILLQSVPQLDISSTRIRQMLQQDEDISAWLPAPVYQQLRDYIDESR